MIFQKFHGLRHRLKRTSVSRSIFYSKVAEHLSLPTSIVAVFLISSFMMICQRCLQANLRSKPLKSTANHIRRTPQLDRPGLSLGTWRRSLTSSTLTNVTPDPRPLDTPHAATSTSAAQPFSTPLTPSPSAQGVSAKPQRETRPPSSVPAGQVLKGLGYIKAKGDPVAMDDSEYPDWLWECLDDTKGKGGDKSGTEGEGDLFCRASHFFLPLLRH